LEKNYEPVVMSHGPALVMLVSSNKNPAAKTKVEMNDAKGDDSAAKTKINEKTYHHYYDNTTNSFKRGWEKQPPAPSPRV